MDMAKLAEIRQHIHDLTADLDVWADRQEPDARARRCANGAMDAIDGMLRELHAMRSELMTEIHASDDATAVRVDALLAAKPTAAVPHGEPGHKTDPMRCDDCAADASADEPPAVVMEAFRQATDPAKLDGCTCAEGRGSHKPPCQWADSAPAPASLDGYSYVLPDDYLRGGAQ
jgi:hypothetical protein